MNCSTLFAYHVQVTKLTEENFDPLPKEITTNYFGTIEEFNKYNRYFEDHKNSFEHKQIARITLIFEFNEIGRDYDAVNKLAAKEAAKLGADWICYVSGTVYKDTEEIASMTYRCVRKPYHDWAEKLHKMIKANENVGKELKTSIFYKIFQERFMLFDKIEEKKQLKMLGIKWKTIKNKENQEKVIYFDVKTRRRISGKEVDGRVCNHIIDQIISVYKENFELYVSEYDKIMQVMKKYPNSTLYFPKLDSEGKWESPLIINLAFPSIARYMNKLFESPSIIGYSFEIIDYEKMRNDLYDRINRDAYN